MGALIASGAAEPLAAFAYHHNKIVKAAAGDHWPKWRGPLTAACCAAFACDTTRHSDVVKLIERLIADTPLERTAIPQLVATDEANARLDRIRAAIARELHPVASAAAASPLAGLPPLPLPELDVTAYSCSCGLREHFENLFDARLSDAAHRALIKQLAGLHAALVHHHDTGGERSDAGLARVLAANGFAGAQFTDWFLTDTARLGAQLDQRLAVYAPLVAAYPEAARRLGTLTAAARGDSQPTKAWRKDGHAALAEVPPAVIAAMMDNLMERPLGTIVDMRGDAALRTLVLLASGLDPAVFAPRLTTFALRHCHAKEPGVGVRDQRMGNACILGLSAMPQRSRHSAPKRPRSRPTSPSRSRGSSGFISKTATGRLISGVAAMPNTRCWARWRSGWCGPLACPAANRSP